MIRRTLGAILTFALGTFVGRIKTSAEPVRWPDDLTPEKAAFIEKEANRLLAHTIDCYDRARAEGTNVLQWLFGTIVGGLGLVGTLIKNDYPCIAGGVLAAAIGAAISVGRLVHSLKSKDVRPPGNRAAALNRLLDIPEHRMRWREAEILDERIEINARHTEDIADAVDSARCSIAWLPVWAILGFLLTTAAFKIYAFCSWQMFAIP